MKLRVALLAAAVMTLSLIAPPPAFADRVSVNITILSPNTANYTGRVKAKSDKCERKRTVQFFQVSDPPVPIGQAITGDNGRYQLQEFVPPKGITVVVLQKHKCKSLQKVVTVP
jgi:hypothetical protein